MGTYLRFRGASFPMNTSFVNYAGRVFLHSSWAKFNVLNVAMNKDINSKKKRSKYLRQVKTYNCTGLNISHILDGFQFYQKFPSNNISIVDF